MGINTNFFFVLEFIKLQSGDEKSNDQIHGDDDDNDVNDDIIILGGGNYRCYKEVEWRFPQVKHCPIRNCIGEFPSRLLAIEHYKAEHAKKMTFCKACDKPFFAKNFAEHKQTATHRRLTAFRASAQVDLLLVVTFL